MRLISQKAMRYGTRRLTAGDEFEATDRDGRILVMARAAAEVAAPPPEDEDTEEKPKRRYRRRDLQAED